MKKYFVVTDIHGFYTEMCDALDDAGFDPTNQNHILVSCGDLLDRGREPVKCLQFINSLPKERKILIRGNHEDLLEQVFIKRNFEYHDITNGTAATCFDIANFLSLPTSGVEMFESLSNYSLLRDYLDNTINYCETKTSIFVHGWIPCATSNKETYQAYKEDATYNPEWRMAHASDWCSARWYNGMEMWNQGIREPNKTIYCGHWHTSWGHAHLHHVCREWDNPRSTNPDHRIYYSEPFVDDGIVALDACTAHSHRANCVTIEEED